MQTNREWWAQRWIDVLESFGWIRRLERARNYARQGNVLSLNFETHKVMALVQGTAPEPYHVSLSLEPFSDEQWDYVIDTLSQRAIFSAKLLAGEMPQNIEEIFNENGLSLFPLNKFDIYSKCSCPDPANPCKHIGAVYYLLGDRFSEDPFVLFQLRGRCKDQIIQTLRHLRQAKFAPETTAVVDETVQPVQSVESPSITVPTIEQFWNYMAQLDSSLVVITPPPLTETILDVLGPIPFKSGEAENEISTAAIQTYLKQLYGEASQRAIALAMTTDPQR
jgi:uncharacterized Zn finger protein